MSKKDYYIIEKNINKIYHQACTNFLDPATYKNIISKLKNIAYKTYFPYPDSDKIIIYTKAEPKIKLIEIESYEKLTHREILGSLFSLNIESEMFGDIVITNDHYYIMVVDSIYNLVINDYKKVGNKFIKLKEASLDTISNYHRKYELIKLIVSSLRIDNIISNLIGMSREQTKKNFLNDEIILNYEICHKLNYELRENDVFSIRKNGKYKYIGIIKETKKHNYIIELNKYIDN